MRISSLSRADRRAAKAAWALCEQLGDKDRIPQITSGELKRARRVLNMVATKIGPDREPYYYVSAGDKQRVRGWFNADGELIDPDSFATALREVDLEKVKKQEARQAKKEMNGVISHASKHPNKYKPPAPLPGVKDMLSAYRSKVLSKQ